jgi:hypothetical protein
LCEQHVSLATGSEPLHDTFESLVISVGWTGLWQESYNEWIQDVVSKCGEQFGLGNHADSSWVIMLSPCVMIARESHGPQIGRFTNTFEEQRLLYIGQS